MAWDRTTEAWSHRTPRFNMNFGVMRMSSWKKPPKNCRLQRNFSSEKMKRAEVMLAASKSACVS